MKLKNCIYITPRFSETDMMRIVHHSRYWSWFEESRFSFLNEILDIPIKEIESSLILMPVISCSCKYIKKIKWGDELLIKTKLEVDNAPYFVFHHEIYYSSDLNQKQLLCKAWTKQAFTDENFMLKFRMPTFLSESINKGVTETSYAFILKDISTYSIENDK